MGSGGGFFSRVKDCVSNGISWVKDKVGGLFSSSKTVGSHASREDSYDPEKARMEETIRINKILTDYRLDVESKSDDFERTILKISRNSIDELLAFLKRINNKKYGNISLNLNLDKISRENRKTEDLIHGFIKKRIQKKVSLDDASCLKVLRMDAGQEKNKAMTSFADSIIKASIDQLTKEIRKSLEGQYDNIINQIENRIENVSYIMNDRVSKMKKIENLKSKDENNLQLEQLELSYMISVCDLIISNTKE